MICNTGFFLGGQCCWSKLLHVYILSCWNLPCNLHVRHMSVQTNHISSAQQSHVTSDWTTGQLRLTSHTETPGPWRQTSYAPLLCAVLSRPVMFHSVRPHGLQPTRLLCPAWDFPGRNTGVGCHALLQGIFPTQWSNLHLLRLPLRHRTSFYSAFTTSKGVCATAPTDFPVFFRTPNNT